MSVCECVELKPLHLLCSFKVIVLIVHEISLGNCTLKTSIHKLNQLSFVLLQTKYNCKSMILRKPHHMNLCLVNQTQEMKGPSIMKENMDDILKEDEEKQGNVS